jgi:hypothetical protein
LRFLGDRRRTEQRQPEIRDALKVPLQLCLVTHWSSQDRSPTLMRERHPGERLELTVIQLTIHRESVGPDCHDLRASRVPGL